MEVLAYPAVFKEASHCGSSLGVGSAQVLRVCLYRFFLQECCCLKSVRVAWILPGSGFKGLLENG